jgi:hypothetical protein
MLFNEMMHDLKEKKATNQGGDDWHAPMALPESQQSGISEHLIGPTLIALGQPI